MSGRSSPQRAGQAEKGWIDVSLPATETPAEVADGRPGWKATLYASWVAQLFSIMAFSLCMPFMPFFIRDLGVRGDALVSWWTGVALTAAGLMLTIFSPIWGTLSDRYGRKIMVERAMFGGAVILFTMGFVTNVYQLVFMRALQGCFTGTVVASTTLVSSITPRKHLAFSLGLMQTAIVSGSCLGPWVGGMIADHYGYRLPFHFSGLLLLVGGLIVLFGVREHFQRLPAGTAARRGLRKAFGASGLVAILSVFFFISFSSTFVSPIFPLFVEKVAVGYKPASITGLLLGVTGLAAGVGALLMGRLSDRLGHRRVLMTTTLCSGVFAALHSLAQNVGQLFTLRVGTGLAGGGTSPAMNAIIGTTVPQEIYGRAYGTCQSASSLGMALGPLAGAALSSALGFRWPFAVMGGLLIVCSMLVARFVRDRDVARCVPGSAPESAAAASPGACAGCEDEAASGSGS